jgi:hypothetical protein
LLESLGLISFYFVYVFVVIVGHMIHSRWKRQRRLLDPIQVEMEDDESLDIDDEVEEFSPDLLRPLLGGMRNTFLIPHDSYRSPLTGGNQRLSQEYDDGSQMLTRISRNEGEVREMPIHLQSTVSYTGIVRQLIPIFAPGKWKFLSSWKRIQYLVLILPVFAFGILPLLNACRVHYTHRN